MTSTFHTASTARPLGRATVQGEASASSLAGLLPEHFGERGDVLYLMPSATNRRVRHWDTISVHAFDRAAGESAVRLPYMRLLLSRTRQSPSATVRVGGGKARHTTLRDGAVSLVPCGATTHVTADAASLVHVFHSLEHYRRAVDELGGSRDVEFDFIPDLANPRIAELVQKLAWEADRLDAGDRLFVEGLSEALAVAVVRHFVDKRPTQPGGLSLERLNRVIDFINGHVANSDLSLHELASVACLSTYQFGRAFRQSTGTTPHQFVLARRVELAKSLLKGGELPLSEVATAAGFADQAHFSNRFRQATGMTPRRFRLAAR